MTSTNLAAGPDVGAWLTSVPVPVWLGLLAVLVLAGTFRRRSRVPRIYARQARGSGLLKGCWRLATGAHLDGEQRTNATWWARGDEDLTRGKRAPKWAFLPRGVRALIRWGVLLALVLWVWGELAAPSTTGIVTLVLVVGLLALAVWRAVRRGGVARWRSRHVEPLGKALAPLVGRDLAAAPADSWVRLPRTLGRDYTDPVVILLPPGFWGSPEQRMHIDAAVSGELGVPLSDLEIRYLTEDREQPRITYVQWAAHDPAARADSGITGRDRFHEKGQTR